MNFDFVALDVETANEDIGSICQIGLAFVKDGKVVNTWGTYVDPETYFSNTWLHGIDEDTVKGAPTFPQLLSQLLPKIQGERIVSHTSFDRVSLDQAAQRYGLTVPEYRHIDSAKMARRADQRFLYKGYSLRNLCFVYSIAYENAHDAKADAETAALLVLYLLENFPPSLDEWEQSLKQRLSSSPGRSGRVRIDGVPGGPLAGQTFVFTGALATPRREVAALTSSLGGHVRDIVSKDVDYLVVGLPARVHQMDNKPSNKEKTARKLLEAGGRIQIITEQEFFSIIEDLT